MAVSILDVAKARAKARGLPEPKNGQDFADLGFDILGGCGPCTATIACYNAYPTKKGYWMCAECVEMSEMGFETVEEFEAWSQQYDEYEDQDEEE